MCSPCGREMTINRAYDLSKGARDLNICVTKINEWQKRSSFLCFFFQDIGASSCFMKATITDRLTNLTVDRIEATK